ncbi:MAG: methylthioribulose 1-phosphate dehydratase [Pseudomonadota bacterium]
MTTDTAFLAAAQTICETGRRIDARGWCPATSSNFSQRIDAGSCAITVSGRDKGALTPDDIMCVDLDGRPLSAGKPSAETLLHTHLYKRDPKIGAVLHTHSPVATLLSQLTRDDAIRLAGWELLKAFEGIGTHEAAVVVPVFDNTQDIARLARDVDRWLDTADTPCHGYLIRGHGIYAWGSTMAHCWRHLETFDYLLGLELERRRIAGR